MDRTSSHESLSALADGYLEGEGFARTVQQLCEDQTLQHTWRTYHLVGEVLRRGSHEPCSDPVAFLQGFRERVVRELPARQPEPAPVVALKRAEASNEPIFRWKLVAGAASLAAVTAIGWNWISMPAAIDAPAFASLRQQAPLRAAEERATLVAQPLQAQVGSRAQLMIRDPRLDQLLEAHREAGGASQMPSGFLRNATFEGPAR